MRAGPGENLHSPISYRGSFVNQVFFFLFVCGYYCCLRSLKVGWAGGEVSMLFPSGLHQLMRASGLIRIEIVGHDGSQLPEIDWL